MFNLFMFDVWCLSGLGLWLLLLSIYQYLRFGLSIDTSVLFRPCQVSTSVNRHHQIWTNEIQGTIQPSFVIGRTQLWLVEKKILSISDSFSSIRRRRNDGATFVCPPFAHYFGILNLFFGFFVYHIFSWILDIRYSILDTTKTTVILWTWGSSLQHHAFFPASMDWHPLPPWRPLPLPTLF